MRQQWRWVSNDPELIRSPHSDASMQRHLMTASPAECACVRYQVALSCSHCDVINQTLQIRRIGYCSAVALSSPMLQITADVPVYDVRHHYRSDTTKKSQNTAQYIFCITYHLGMHKISGSGLPDIRPFLISDSGSGGKLPDSESESLLIYCVLFCNLSDLHGISTLNIQYVHSVWVQSARVCGDVIMCMQTCKVTLNYLHIIHCHNTVTENLGNELSINCIAVHYLDPVPVPVGYLICYPALSGYGQIPKNSIQCIPTSIFIFSSCKFLLYLY